MRRIAYALASLCVLAVASAQAADSSTLRIAIATFALKPGHPYRSGTLPAVLPLQAAFDPLVKLDKTGKAAPAHGAPREGQHGEGREEGSCQECETQPVTRAGRVHSQRARRNFQNSHASITTMAASVIG